ncbi:MAG: aryl-sulfate sulfotransferase [Myxococcales bacterium]|nr:aryl-sulfate sulfotransferase [Myxococcales bacterium]
MRLISTTSVRRATTGALLLLVACTSGSNDPTTSDFMITAGPTTGSSTAAPETTTPETAATTTGEELPEIIDLYIYENPANVLSFFVEWETSAPGTGELTVECGEEYSQTFVADAEDTLHEAFVMGLLADTTCVVTLSAKMGETVDTRVVEHEVGPIPAPLPSFAVIAADEAAMEPGWTLVNLVNGFIDAPLHVAALDPKGRIRWYHGVPTVNEGSDTDVRTVPEGVMVGGTRSSVDPFIFDWEGNTLWTDDLFMHHDLRTADGDSTDSLWYLGRSYECDASFMGIYVDSVVLYDRVAGAIAWEWLPCDHITPFDLHEGWDHLNTIEPDGEDGLLISARNQHQLWYVDRTTSALLWKMGWDTSDFAVDEDAVFGRQHAPELQDNGNILLFDNGFTDTREWSRGLEIAYDLETMEVHKVWEFRPQPDIFCPIWGDADRLANGNTLMVFGRRGATDDTHLFEADANAEVVWHVATPEGWGVYRSERMAPRFGEIKR